MTDLRLDELDLDRNRAANRASVDQTIDELTRPDIAGQAAGALGAGLEGYGAAQTEGNADDILGLATSFAQGGPVAAAVYVVGNLFGRRNRKRKEAKRLREAAQRVIDIPETEPVALPYVRGRFHRTGLGVFAVTAADIPNGPASVYGNAQDTDGDGNVLSVRQTLGMMRNGPTDGNPSRRGWDQRTDRYRGTGVFGGADGTVVQAPILLQQVDIAAGRIRQIVRVDSQGLRLNEDNLLAQAFLGRLGPYEQPDPIATQFCSHPGNLANIPAIDRRSADSTFLGTSYMTGLCWQVQQAATNWKQGDRGRPPLFEIYGAGPGLRRIVHTGAGTESDPYAYAEATVVDTASTNNPVVVEFDRLRYIVGIRVAGFDLESWYDAQEQAGRTLSGANPTAACDIDAAGVVVSGGRVTDAATVTSAATTVSQAIETAVTGAITSSQLAAQVLEDVAAQTAGTTLAPAELSRSVQRAQGTTAALTTALATQIPATINGLPPADRTDRTQLVAAVLAAIGMALASTIGSAIAGVVTNYDFPADRAFEPGERTGQTNPSVFASLGLPTLRYEFDGEIPSDDLPIEQSRLITQTMPGSLIYRDHKGRLAIDLPRCDLSAEAQRVGTLNEDVILRVTSYDTPKPSDRMTGAETRFRDAADDMRTATESFPTPGSPLEAQLKQLEGEIVRGELELEGVVNRYHAHSISVNYTLISQRKVGVIVCDITPETLSYVEGNILGFEYEPENIDDSVRVLRTVLTDGAVIFIVQEYDPVDYSFHPRSAEIPGLLPAVDLSPDVPSNVTANKLPDGNHVAIDWMGGRRNVEAWEVARYEGTTGATGNPPGDSKAVGADGAALFAVPEMPPAVTGEVYGLVQPAGFALPDALFTDAAGDNPRFHSVDIGTTAGSESAQLIFRDSDSGNYPAGPHLAIPASRLVVVLQVGDQTWGIRLDPTDTAEPYALASPLPTDLLTVLRAEIAKPPANRLTQRVAMVDTETWLLGTDWAKAFGRTPPSGDDGWVPVAGSPVPVDAAQSTEEVLARGSHDYYFRVRARGVGGGFSPWAYSALHTLEDNFAVPDIGRPTTGPIFCFDVPAGFIGRAVTRPGKSPAAEDDLVPPANLPAGRAYLKTFWLNEATDPSDRTKLSQPTPQALTRIWRIWASIDDPAGEDGNSRYFAQVRGTTPIAAVVLWWEDLPRWWVMIQLARRADGNNGVGVATDRNFFSVDVAEEPDDADADAASVLAREYGPRWNIPNAAPADEVSDSRRLCMAFTVAQDGKDGADGVDGEDAAAFLDDVPFTVT